MHYCSIPSPRIRPGRGQPRNRQLKPRAEHSLRSHARWISAKSQRKQDHARFAPRAAVASSSAHIHRSTHSMRKTRTDRRCRTNANAAWAAKWAWSSGHPIQRRTAPFLLRVNRGNTSSELEPFAHLDDYLAGSKNFPLPALYTREWRRSGR